MGIYGMLFPSGRNSANRTEPKGNTMDMNQTPLRFITLPDSLPKNPTKEGEQASARYARARWKMYQAQLAAVEIAARACWPSDYREADGRYRAAIREARRFKAETLLDLFSMECNSYKR